MDMDEEMGGCHHLCPERWMYDRITFLIVIRYNRCVNIWTRAIHINGSQVQTRKRSRRKYMDRNEDTGGCMPTFCFVNDGWIIISHPCLVTIEAEKYTCCLPLKLLLHLCMLTSVKRRTLKLRKCVLMQPTQKPKLWKFQTNRTSPKCMAKQ